MAEIAKNPGQETAGEAIGLDPAENARLMTTKEERGSSFTSGASAEKTKQSLRTTTSLPPVSSINL